MNRVRRVLQALWGHKWIIIATVVVVALLVREWSPPAYHLLSSTVTVTQPVVTWGDPLVVRINRCNDTSQTVLGNYVRRLHSDDGEIWPLQEGTAVIDPGCLERRVEAGYVPRGLPPGVWRIRTDYRVTNWAGKTVRGYWISDPFEVVVPNG